MPKVKICGVSTPDALEAAVEAGADWIGFVFFPPSPRAVTPSHAASLWSHSGSGAAVGLFVDPTDEEVERALTAVPLVALQIYTDAKRAASLRHRFGVPVWLAVSIEDRDDLPASALGVDALLLDAKAPAGGTIPGGNAHSFDWFVLRGWAAPAPWMLAGGLTVGNVAAALRVSRAEMVDVSSGVERERGVKDAELIRRFVRAAKHEATGFGDGAPGFRDGT